LTFSAQTMGIFTSPKTWCSCFQVALALMFALESSPLDKLAINTCSSCACIFCGTCIDPDVGHAFLGRSWHRLRTSGVVLPGDVCALFPCIHMRVHYRVFCYWCAIHCSGTNAILILVYISDNNRNCGILSKCHVTYSCAYTHQ